MSHDANRQHTHIFQYRIVKNNNIVTFRSRDDLPIELRFLRYVDDNWVRFMSDSDGYEIDICYLAIINLMPEFSTHHRHINLSYGNKSYLVHVINPKESVAVPSQDVIYRINPSELVEDEPDVVDEVELRSEPDEPTQGTGWEKIYQPWPRFDY